MRGTITFSLRTPQPRILRIDLSDESHYDHNHGELNRGTGMAAAPAVFRVSYRQHPAHGGNPMTRLGALPS